MNVDLNNTNEYDKQVIFLDSKNGTYNDNNSFDFYIKFDDPIKNISNVKIIDASLILESPTSRTLNNNDIYYIELNEYHRTFSYIKNKNMTFKYFDNIYYNKSDHNATTSGLSKFKVSYPATLSNWTDPSLYTLNPIAHNIRRFSIKIKDKDLNILTKLSGESFNMTICVYTIKKNIYG
jgi:hypothetical protein